MAIENLVCVGGGGGGGCGWGSRGGWVGVSCMCENVFARGIRRYYGKKLLTSAYVQTT